MKQVPHAVDGGSGDDFGMRLVAMRHDGKHGELGIAFDITARAVTLTRVNFNVYLDEDLARRLAAVAKRTGAPRNALIRQAIASWVGRAGAGWPSIVTQWKGDPSVTPFEDLRSELTEPGGDPFGAPLRVRRPRASATPSPARRARKRSR